MNVCATLATNQATLRATAPRTLVVCVEVEVILVTAKLVVKLATLLVTAPTMSVTHVTARLVVRLVTSLVIALRV